MSDDTIVKLKQDLKASKMWKLCDSLQDKEQNTQYKEQNNYILEESILYAAKYIETINGILPQYTIHGIKHSFNVLDLMWKLLSSMHLTPCENHTGGGLPSSYEIAMLILAAFFHDIGMCLLKNNNNEEIDIVNEPQYLYYINRHSNSDSKILKADYLRECHHLRVRLFLDDLETKLDNNGIEFKWKMKNGAGMSFSSLKDICQSHNEGELYVNNMLSTLNKDKKFCAIILRLSDILDLDDTRAPLKVMKSINFEKDERSIKSLNEWKKHQSSDGIIFNNNNQELYLTGNTKDPIIYQKLDEMVFLINKELELCRALLLNTSETYNNKVLPQRITNMVEAQDFEIGDYSYEIEKKDIIKLFMGENLYMDKMVFVRELLQNAIDASLYYQKLKQNSYNEVAVKNISLHVWKGMNDDVYFLIEDNGTGMNKNNIIDFFLKIGKSFYSSQIFKDSGVNFTSISRFGVGFLSVFLVTEEVVVMTKYHEDVNILLELTLNLNADKYILRKNDLENNRYDIHTVITDWNGDSKQLATLFANKDCGTIIYFKLNDEIVNGSLEPFQKSVNAYLFNAPVEVDFYSNRPCDKYFKKEYTELMEYKCVQLEKEAVCTALNLKTTLFKEGEEIFFETLPIYINHSDNNGKIEGCLQLLIVYDKKARQKIYKFNCKLLYEEDLIIISLKDYQKTIKKARLNSDCEKFGVMNQIKVYFNGINHLSGYDIMKNDSWKNGYLNGYLLLEGKYRPEVDVSRSGKGYLDLNTIARFNYLYWEILQNYAGNDIYKRYAYFSFIKPDIFHLVDDQIYRETEKLEKIMKWEKWNDLSIINTGEGFLSINEIKSALNRVKDTEIELLENIKLNQVYNFKLFIIQLLLEKNFEIILKINDGIDKIYIRSKNNMDTHWNDLYVPPLFSIQYENLDILKYENYPLNSLHWFTKWFVKKSKSASFNNTKVFLLRNFQKNFVNNVSIRNNLTENINRILHKDENIDRNLNNKDINIDVADNKDFRDWLQILD